MSLSAILAEAEEINAQLTKIHNHLHEMVDYIGINDKEPGGQTPPNFLTVDFAGPPPGTQSAFQVQHDKLYQSNNETIEQIRQQITRLRSFILPRETELGTKVTY